MSISPDVVRRLTVEYSTPGVDTAIAQGRAFVDVQKSSAAASALQEKAYAGVEQSLRRAYASAQQGFLQGVQGGAQGVGATLVDAAAAIHKVAPVVAAEIGALSPALGILGKEATVAAVGIGKELAPALGGVVSGLQSVLGPAALAIGAYLGVAAAIAYLAKTAGASVNAFKDFEDGQVKLQATLNVTAGASGKTAAEIEKLVESVGDIGKTREAAQDLLKFGSSVSGGNFDTVLRLAKDLSTSGGSITENAKNLGKALKDLSGDGLKPLADAGIRFTVAQTKMIEGFRDAGREADAQRLVLKLVQDQVGGASGAKDNSLSGSLAALSDAFKLGSEQSGQFIVQVTQLTAVVRALADAVTLLNGISPSALLTMIGSLPAAIGSGGALGGLPDLLARAGASLGSGGKPMGSQVIPRTPAANGGSGWGATATELAADEVKAKALDDIERVQKVMQDLRDKIATDAKSDIQQKIDEQLKKARLSPGVPTVMNEQQMNDAAEIERLTREANKDKDAKVNGYDMLIQRTKDHIDELKLEAESAGKATGEVIKLKLQHDAERAAKKAGVEVDQEKLDKLKEELALQTRMVALARVRSDTGFERSTMFLSADDQQIAGKLRGVYGDNWQGQMNSFEANQIRVNQQLKLTKDLTTEFATGFAHDFKTDLQNGANAWDAFGKAGLNALNRLSDRLMDMAINNLVGKALGGLFGTGGGGLVAMTPFAGATGVTGANGPFVTPTYHAGGIVGRDGGAPRYVHPAYFEQAPRFAMGGVAGLGPDEVPIVAHRDEEVIRRDDPRHRYNGGGGSTFAPVYNIDASGADVAAIARLERALASHARATAEAFARRDDELTASVSQQRRLTN
jgi:hypothetical protein